MRNRDLPLLGRIYDMMQEIESLQGKCEFIREHMYNITRQITGMPGGGGNMRGYDMMLGEMDEMIRKYVEKISDYTKELRRAERILNGIPDVRNRTLVRMYYVDSIRQADILKELDVSEYQFQKFREKVEEADRMRDVVWA